MAQTPWSDSRAEAFLHMVFVVAVLEQGVKFGVAWLLTYRSALFKRVYGEVLFCASAALGFATLENVLFVFTGDRPAFGVAISRALTPVHLV